MPATRQNNPRPAGEGAPVRHRLGEGGFTLIELLLVLALLAIVTALAAPQMISFFRGRALNEEGRRLLALTHYAQSRAVSEGVPVVLWLDPTTGTYGQNIQPGFTAHDDRASTFSLESSLTLEVPAGDTPPVSEQGDEILGLPDGQPMIRFTPDGYFDYASVPRFILRQGTEAALQIAPTANRLAYEVQPYAPDQP